MSFSRFFNPKYLNIAPYDTTGEHLNLDKFIKLNTNESPFPPSPIAIKYASEAARGLNLYSDPDCTELTLKLADTLNIDKDEILFGNGSDEILNFAFAAFCDLSGLTATSPCRGGRVPPLGGDVAIGDREGGGAAFSDITYSFYKVLAKFHGVPFVNVELHDDFKIYPEDYMNINKTIFIANPNAPTGLAMSVEDVEKILISNPDNVVVIDEAYVDFGAESCVDLIHKYNNLIVVQTFSKSRSLAGGRLGFAAACPELIRDLKAIKNSLAPYNINSMTQAAALGAIEDRKYFEDNINLIIKSREFTSIELKKLGFEMTNSIANFVFARHDKISGIKLFDELNKRRILVRHFENPERLKPYNRITIGSQEQMQILIDAVKEILNQCV